MTFLFVQQHRLDTKQSDSWWLERLTLVKKHCGYNAPDKKRIIIKRCNQMQVRYNSVKIVEIVLDMSLRTRLKVYAGKHNVEN